MRATSGEQESAVDRAGGSSPADGRMLSTPLLTLDKVARDEEGVPDEKADSVLGPWSMSKQGKIPSK